MIDTYSFSRVSRNQYDKFGAITEFLAGYGLGVDADVERFVVAKSQDQIIACGGLAGNILKSIAIDPVLHGSGFSLRLMTELTAMAYEMDRFELFLFTKPENIKLFRNSGFYPIAYADDKLVLMENSQTNLSNFINELKKDKKTGKKIGSIVMNANPFTLGHQYLVEVAAAQCDWLHVFIVSEEGCGFSYTDRFNMIVMGTENITNITLHKSSNYIISKATFPTYFIKDKCLIDYCHTAIDLNLFRHHIAPALGITHRFVGSEPECMVTNYYNQQMKYRLTVEELTSPVVNVVEVARKCTSGQPISASTVRGLLKKGEWELLSYFLPITSIDYLHQHPTWFAWRNEEIAAA
ncbi:MULTISPECIES: [citrate (pro-3S)-lyase] ligase [Vibrio]|nr:MULTISPECIES: [citrate (pro-3S)-lyase] ligase [Vibrio]NNN45274.1 [citrate (pro-3S)-lyase] ligase [Vibrio sp. 1-1(7)]NNN72647.1 [citrate (pro-3S)-lyase] ligase [Vibrio sp. 12-2(3-a)]